MQTIVQARLLFLAAMLSALALTVRAADEPKPADQPKAQEPPKPARQQLKPERLVSDNTFLYVSTPDMRKARAAFERTAFRALLREDEVAQPLLTAFGKLRDAYVKGDGTRGEPEMRRRSNEVDLLSRIAPLLDGQVALAIEGDASGALSGSAPPRFLLAVSMAAGDEGEKWLREMEGILEKHRAGQGMDPRVKDTEERVASYDVIRLENADLGLVETWAFVENLFLYGQGKRIVEDAIDRYSVKNGAGTLALHAGYQDAYKQAGRDDRSDALLYLQADVRPLLKQLLASSPEAQKVLDPKMAALEANRPQFAMGMHVAEGENAAIKEKLLFRTGKDTLPRAGGACEGVTARFASNATLLFLAQQAGLADVYKNFTEGMKRGKPEAEGGEPKESSFFDRVKGPWGVQNEADLLSKLELFKGEFGFFISYAPQVGLGAESKWEDFLEAFQPVVALELDPVNAVADTTLRTWLQSIQKATGHEYLPTTSAGVPIFYQKGAAPREDAASGTPLGLLRNLISGAPADKVPFFVANARVDVEVEGGKQRKFLLLAESLNAIKTAALQSQAKFGRSSLAEDKKFRDLCKGFRESRNTLGYLDLPRLVNVYADELPRLIRGTQRGRKLMEQLPSANVLRDHVFPMGWATSVITDPDGLLIECASPMGNLPMVGVVTALGWPAIIQKQQEAVSDDVDARFRRLMLALHLYAANFNHFPQQMSDLFPNYVKGDLRLFESPFKRGAVKTPQDIDSPALTNLVYVPDHSLQDLGSDILVYEKEPTKLIETREGPKLFYHVLTLDAKKAWMTKASLDRALSGKAELPGMTTTEAPVRDTKK